jgi:DNA helicase-2/ATP-dependent DNA helicase PcrA
VERERIDGHARRLPSFHAKKKGDASDEMREERRNCFVPITWAEETLTLTFANTYFGWQKEPSRFLADMELLRRSEF